MGARIPEGTVMTGEIVGHNPTRMIAND
jgi:hypothetical protein